MLWKHTEREENDSEENVGSKGMANEEEKYIPSFYL